MLSSSSGRRPRSLSPSSSYTSANVALEPEGSRSRDRRPSDGREIVARAKNYFTESDRVGYNDTRNSRSRFGAVRRRQSTWANESGECSC